MASRKFYVVWDGFAPGVYDSWEECKQQIHNYPNARYKAFPTQEAAVNAFRGDPVEQLALFKAISERRPTVANYASIPEIRLNAIAVDAACSKNPGPVEYRGVMVESGQQIFHVGPLPDGTNNIGEYLALVHAAALLAQRGDTTTPIYSDSRTAISWVRRRQNRSQITPTAKNQRIIQLLQRADYWLQHHSIPNPIIKWETERWGEIPADFGRK